MPNWIEGSIKVRGPRENVKKFFTEGIHIYQNRPVKPGDKYFDGSEIPKNVKTAYLPIPKEEWMHTTEYDNGDIDIYFFGENERWAHVEGSKRAFITDEIYIHKEKDLYIGVSQVHQAWGFETDDWIEISKKYHVDIRLWGLEGGMQFGQEIEIHDGNVIIDKDMVYDTWTMPLPWIGG